MRSREEIETYINKAQEQLYAKKIPIEIYNACVDDSILTVLLDIRDFLEKEVKK